MPADNPTSRPAASQATSPASRDDLFARLDALGLRHRTVAHPPIMTVDEGRALKRDMPGGHTKNLFVKDKKGARFLVSAHCDTQIDLVALGRAIGAKGRLSFGAPDLMLETIGVAPGSVTAFAAINAAPGGLRTVILDERLFEFEVVWFHPLKNDASTAISPNDLAQFLVACGWPPDRRDLGALSR